MAYVPATPELGIFVEQGGAPTSNGQVTSITPNNRVNGAIESVLAHPTNPDVVYVGSINGGIWRTDNATASNPDWTPQTDHLPSLTIGAIEFDTEDTFFTNPSGSPFQTLVAGTGNYSSFGGAGGSVGSVYVTHDGGDTWVDPGSIGLAGIRVSGIASKDFGNTIVVSSDDFFNGGIYRSTDGGATFTEITIEAFPGIPADRFNDLFADLSAYNRLYASGPDGIFRSDDFGLTWNNVSQSNAALQGLLNGGGISNTEMVVHPSSGRLFVGIIVGGQPAGLFYTDTGDTVSPIWREMDVPILPIANATNITGVTNTSPISIRAVGHGLQTGDLVLVNGVRDSTNSTPANGQWVVTRVDNDNVTLNLSNGTGGGTYTANTGQITKITNPSPTFKDTSVPGSQGRIHFSIGIDPNDHDIVYIGGDRQDTPFPNAIGASNFTASLFRGDVKISRDPLQIPSPQWDHLTDDSNAFDPSGGTANGSAPHADSRDIAFDANGNMLEVNDGGIFRRTSPQDNSGIWVSLSGSLGVFEYHDVAYDSNSNVILAGAQDNGTQYQLNEDQQEWSLMSGGDGGDVVVDNITLAGQGQSIRYSSFQNLGGFRSTVWDANNNQISGTNRPLVVTSGAPLQPQFDTSVVLNAIDPRQLIIGARNGVYESFSQGNSITQASTFNVPGGVANPMAYGGRSAVHGDNAAVVYAGDAFGNVYVREETVSTFTTNIDIGGTVLDIRMNPNEWWEAVAIDSDTVARTTDKGSTWDDITGNLGTLGATAFRAMEYISTTIGGKLFEGLVLGTNQGVYAMTFDAVGTWFEFGSNVPNAPIYDMDYDPADDVLVLGTLGRGAWKLKDASTFLAPAVSLSVAPDTVNESDAFVTYTATLSRVYSEDILVPLQANATSPDNGPHVATEGVDYIAPVSILIPAGSLTATAQLIPLQDSVDEFDETAVIEIDGAALTNARVFGVASATTTIVDDDPAVVNLTLDRLTIGEASESAIIGASIGALSPVDIVIDLQVDAASSAMGSGVDYINSNLQITIPAGSLTGTTSLVTSVQDTLDEPDETVIVSIAGVSPGAVKGSTDSVTVTIVDDDAPPTVTLSATPASIAEAGGVATFTALLSTISGFDVVVDLEVVQPISLGPFATAGGVDFIDPVLRIVIPAGSLQGSTTVTAVPDVLDESDELVLIDIANVTRGTELGQQRAQTIILDDDPEPTISLAVDNTTIPENGGVATFTVSLNTVSGRDVTFNFELSGDALPGLDYSHSPLSVTIPAGHTQAALTVTAVDEAVSFDEEDQEIVGVQIVNAVNAGIATPGVVTTAILDDDDAPNVTFESDVDSILENSGVATFTATLSEVSGRDVFVEIQTAGVAIEGIGPNDGDYFIPPPKNITIPAGQTTGFTRVIAVQDNRHEGDEQVIVNVASVVTGLTSDVVTTGVLSDSVLITDDDPVPSVALSGGAAAISEASGTTTFTATLSHPSVDPITVAIDFTGTAINGTDYTASQSTLTFAPGATTATVTITADEDTLDEFNESVVLTLVNPTNAILSGSVVASTTITDNDAAPLVTLAVDKTSVTESTESIVYTATLSTLSGKDVVIDLTLGGSATAGVDFTGLTTPITIAAGSISTSFTAVTVADGIDEVDEDLIVNVSAVTNGIEDGVQGVSTTIIDVDPFPTVTLSMDPDTIGEDDQSTTLTATLSEISSRDITIDLDFGGDAQLGIDYTVTQTQIVIPAGSLSESVTLQSVEDSIDELHEQIVVTIAAVDFATESSPQSAIATITDNDLAPTVTLTSNQVSISEAAGQAVFTATLSAISGLDVTVNLASSGTAVETDDYTVTGNSILIPAGSISGAITVTAIDDSLDEVDETVVRDISGLTNATTLGPQSASTLILDNDAPPVVTLRFQTPSIIEGDAAIKLFADLSAPSSRDVTVSLSLLGTATDIDDYAVSDVTIFIPAGSTSGSVTIDVVDDGVFEDDETVIASVLAVVNATSPFAHSDTLTILSEDAAPNITLTSNQSSIDEDGNATITATLDAVSEVPVTVTLGLSGDATLGSDYLASETTLLIPAGSLSASMVLTSIEDTLDEVDEVITVSITNLVGAATQSPQSVDVTILDNDLAPQASLVFVPTSISETGGEAELQVNLSAASGKEITVSLAAVGTATGGGVDYLGMQNSVTIPAGATSASFTISAVGDAIDENDETLSVSIQSLVNANAGILNAATLTILDDDLPPTVTLAIDNPVLAEASGSAIVTATLSEPSGLEVVVTLGLTGSASSEDYSITGTSIVIPAGSTIGTAVITATQDLLDEPDETIVIDVTNVTAAIEQVSQQVSATIIDDDNPPTVTLAVDQATLVESDGGVATVSATLSGASGNDVTIDLEVTGTAETSDFTPIPLQILIPAGETTGSVTFSPVDDSLDELDETVDIAIVAVSGAIELGDQSTTTTILDDDDAPNLSLLTDLASIDEASGQAVLTVQMSAISELDVSATISLSGTATAGGVDYTASNLQVSIPAGSLTASITIDALEDLLYEQDELIVAQVQSATNAGFDPAASTTVTIVDNDLPPTVTFVMDVTEIAENGGIATYTATISEPSGLDVVITPTITTTADPSDFTLSATSLVIPAGSTTGTLTITGVEDELFEHDELLTVSPSQIVNATALSVVDSVVNIIDDDPFPSLTLRLANTTVVEGDSEDVVIELSEVAGVDIMVDLTLTGTATETGDYTISSKSVILPAGQKSITVSIDTVNDALDEIVENISISASASDGVIIGSQATANLDILDNDPPPTANVRVDNFTLDELGGQAIMTVQLSQASGRDVVFDISLAGKAISDVDYSISAQQLVVPAGSTTASVLIQTIDDSVFEDNEEIQIFVSAADSDTVDFTDQTLTLNLIDNEARPSVSLVSDVTSIAEADGVATITATLSGLSDSDVVVQTSIVGQGDVTSDDFSVSSTSIVIPAGQLSGSITITATNDPFVEQDGVVGLTVTSVTGNFQTLPDQLSITIIDDDEGRLLITSAADPIVVGEDGSTAEFSVNLTAAPLADVVVVISSSDTGEVTVSPRSLVFTPLNWNQPQSVTVTGQPDLFEDGNIAVDVLLSINESVSDVGFAGLGTTVVDVVNTNLSFQNLQLVREGDQLIVRDQNTGRTLDTRPVIDGERLRLNLAGGAKRLNIASLGDFQNIIEIDMQADDTINYGGGWVADQPRFIDGRYTHVLRRDKAILYVRNVSPNVNPYNPHDTNRDGVITPSDALVIINQLPQNGGVIATPGPDDALRNYYPDVNGDNVMTALDALQVINFINRFKSGYDASLSIADFLAANQNGQAEAQAEWTGSSATTIVAEPVAAVMGSAKQDQGTVDQAILDMFDDKKADSDESAELSETLADALLGSLV